MKYIHPQDHHDNCPECHPSHRLHHVKPINEPLYVITVVSNPDRYYARYRLYQAFEQYVEESGGILYTVELALRDRHFEVTRADNPRHIQIRSPEILWLKENMMNIALTKLPANWAYVAWVDADVTFARPDWVYETLHQLQKYKVVQMWSQASDLGPQHQVIATYNSLMHTYLRNHHILEPVNRKAKHPHKHNKNADGRNILVPSEAGDYGGGSGSTGKLHTGYAWAARRSAISDLGGFGDIGILGSGDRHMAYALLGHVEQSYPAGVHPHYKQYWLRWQQRAIKYINYNVGVVPGLLLHGFHGSKQYRRYNDRWQILVKHKFDPIKHLTRDPQGILQLDEDAWKLRDDIRQYFAERNEDDISL